MSIYISKYSINCKLEPIRFKNNFEASKSYLDNPNISLHINLHEWRHHPAWQQVPACMAASSSSSCMTAGSSLLTLAVCLCTAQRSSAARLHISFISANHPAWQPCYPLDWLLARMFRNFHLSLITLCTNHDWSPPPLNWTSFSCFTPSMAESSWGLTQSVNFSGF